jgi:hypothetical protein
MFILPIFKKFSQLKSLKSTLQRVFISNKINI